jgi:hypothetical protein
MPAEANASAQEDGDDGTQTAGSQLRCVHGGCRRSHAKCGRSGYWACEDNPKSPAPPPFGLTGMELPPLAVVVATA